MSAYIWWLPIGYGIVRSVTKCANGGHIGFLVVIHEMVAVFHMRACIHVHMRKIKDCTHWHTRAHTHKHTRTHDLHMCVYAHKKVYTHMTAWIARHTCIHTCIHAFVHTHFLA